MNQFNICMNHNKFAESVWLRKKHLYLSKSQTIMVHGFSFKSYLVRTYSEYSYLVPELFIYCFQESLYYFRMIILIDLRSKTLFSLAGHIVITERINTLTEIDFSSNKCFTTF